MLNSTVLEVAIGLVFCYASVALISSSVYEAIAAWLNLRSKTLLAGIKNLLNAHDAASNELTLKIYNHALAHPTGNGAAVSLDELKNNPSYIEPKHFAIALIDAIQTVPNDFVKLGTDIDSLSDSQIRQLLRGMYGRAAGNVEQLHADLAAWFDSSMDRVSGSYKRQSQTWCFVIAFVFAVIFNVDSIHLFATLWQHTALVAQIAMPTATHHAEEAYTGLKSLPIGWQTDWLNEINRFSIIGWLITATAALFGAPFWFDLLQQLIRIRGTGPKPQPLVGAAPSATNSTSTSAPSTTALATERNTIIDLHAERNKDDPSYRPVQSGEHW